MSCAAKSFSFGKSHSYKKRSYGKKRRSYRKKRSFGKKSKGKKRSFGKKGKPKSKGAKRSNYLMRTFNFGPGYRAQTSFPNATAPYFGKREPFNVASEWWFPRAGGKMQYPHMLVKDN